MAADMQGSLLDLLVALAAQRHEFDWSSASQNLQSLLASGNDWEGMYVAAALRPHIHKLSYVIRTLRPLEAPTAAECERRFAELSSSVGSSSEDAQVLVDHLVAARLKALATKRHELVARINELSASSTGTLKRSVSKEAVSESVRTPSAAASGSSTAPPPAAKQASAADTAAAGTGGGLADENGSGAGRTRLASPADIVPPDGGGVDERWADIAEEEDKHARRSSVSSTLTKMLMVIQKHKWAHPFKRPVTDKEAPDYKDIIKNPMDFWTLRKRVESGVVCDVPALVSDLYLIFDNAMVYNAHGSDYHKMAHTLKENVKYQYQLYNKWAAERKLGNAPAAADASADDSGADPPAPAADEEVTVGSRGRSTGRGSGRKRSSESQLNSTDDGIGGRRKRTRP